ncbi:MAG TPA: aromatic ring-hydroxylating dioxygenase subunit alpha [Ilumatobacter sp.]|nr:aromatic ring-hydroxylating dioxygenase subunit alpha [Ilumatobacter sp.]
MERDAELAIGDRIAALVDESVGRSVAHIDASVYTDPHRHAAELAALRRNPAIVAYSSELGTVGDFVVRELWGTPIVVARDNNGVHCYVNACAHRGATVVTEPCGRARLHSCPFHGWSYELDGSLRTISEPDRFGYARDVSTSSVPVGLRRLACEERHGCIWAVEVGDTPNLDATQGMDVAAWLTPSLDELFFGLGLADMACFRTATYHLACNWKMITDGFLETYHLKYLHRASIAPYFPSNQINCDRHGPHFTTFLPKNRLLTQIAERDRDDWDIVNHITMSTTLVPGTVVQWQAGHVEVFALRPHLTNPRRCSVDMAMLVPSDRLHEADLWNRNWSRLANTIPAEDFVAAEDVQRNIDCGAVTRLTVGATEHHLVDHLAEIKRLLA